MKANTEELIAFINVVESRSFSRAAEKLGQANSVVSRLVKRLETKLNVTLLNRTTRQITLTHEGERYYHQVKQSLDALEIAEASLQDSLLKPQGLLRIDAATPVLLHVLVPFIADFKEHYPDIELSLTASENFINLIERKVDIAIRIGELHDSTLRARKLKDSYRYIVASPAYLKRYGVPDDISKLKKHLCLGFDLPHLNIWPIGDADKQGHTITSTLNTNNGETLRQLCLHGNGIACLSDYMIMDDINSGRLISILEHRRLPVNMPINAVYYSDQTVSNRIRCFIDFLSDCVK